MKLNENLSSPIPGHTKIFGFIVQLILPHRTYVGRRRFLHFLSSLLNHKTTKKKLQKVNEVHTCLSDSKVGKMSIAVTLK